jgi:hypothetical protein
MPTIDQNIDNTILLQDIELAAVIADLRKNPAELTKFLGDQQMKVYNDVTNQKKNTYDKVYGDLGRAVSAQGSIAMNQQRSKELIDVHNQVYDNQKNMANMVMEDKNMSGRKHEMNEWTVNNKKDTLFVFSSMFIMLSGLLLITVLWRMGMIGSTLWAALGAPLIIICAVIILNRAQYTNALRNKRYWNKKIFEGTYGKIPIPNICPNSSA